LFSVKTGKEHSEWLDYGRFGETSRVSRQDIYLKTKAECFSQTLISVYQIKRCHILEESSPKIIFEFAESSNLITICFVE